MTGSRGAALQIAAFPVLLAVGVLLIPVVPDYSDQAAATRAMEEPARWFLGHLLSAVAFGVAVLTSGALRQIGATRLVYTVLIALGAALHAAGLGADGIAPVALATAGASPAAFFDGSGVLVPGVFVLGAVLFGVGQLFQVGQLSRGLPRGPRIVALTSAIVFSAAEAIPSGWGLYLVGLAALVLYLPLGLSAWRGVRPSAAGPRSA